MKTNTIDNIIENLFYVIPLIRKKLLKIETPEVNLPVNLSAVHVGIMAIIDEEKSLSISEIARRLLIPKPQMTLMINHLVKSGLVEKQSSAKDGRVTSVVLTPAGKTTFKGIEDFMKSNVRKNLSYLSDKELDELSQILVRLRELGSRFDTKEK